MPHHVDLEELLELSQYRSNDIPCYPGNLWVIDALMKEVMRAGIIGDNEYARALEDTRSSVCRYPFKVRNFQRVPLMSMTKRVRDYLSKQPNYSDRIQVDDELRTKWFQQRGRAAMEAMIDLFRVTDLSTVPIADPLDPGLAWPKVLKHRSVETSPEMSGEVEANNATTKQTDTKPQTQKPSSSVVEAVPKLKDGKTAQSKSRPAPPPSKGSGKSSPQRTQTTIVANPVGKLEAAKVTAAGGALKVTALTSVKSQGAAETTDAKSQPVKSTSTISKSGKKRDEPPVRAETLSVRREAPQKKSTRRPAEPMAVEPKAAKSPLPRRASATSEFSSLTADQTSMEGATTMELLSEASSRRAIKTGASKEKAETKRVVLSTRTRTISAVYNAADYDMTDSEESDRSFRPEDDSEVRSSDESESDDAPPSEESKGISSEGGECKDAQEAPIPHKNVRAAWVKAPVTSTKGVASSQLQSSAGGQAASSQKAQNDVGGVTAAGRKRPTAAKKSEVEVRKKGKKVAPAQPQESIDSSTSSQVVTKAPARRAARTVKRGQQASQE